MPSPKPKKPASVSLRAMELSALPTAVHLHRTTLPTGFFVELGDRFLTRYYRTFLTSPAAVALVAEIDGKIGGFLVGSSDEIAHHRHVIDLSRWGLARAGATALLARPELTARFLRTRARRYMRGIRRSSESSEPAQERAPRTGVLSHIAVDQNLRRSGVGAALVEGFTQIAAVHDVEVLRLYTSDDNEAARTFYKRLGWQEQEIQHDIDGKPWILLTLDL